MSLSSGVCEIDIAYEDDIPSLCTLLALLFEQETEFVPDPEAQRCGLATIIDNPAIGHVFVARDGDSVIGMANLLYTVSTALGERVALLEDVVVAPSHRRRGIGAQLINTVLAFARRQGCRRITLLTDTSNDTAQHFYAKHGFVRSAMMPMRRLLTED